MSDCYILVGHEPVKVGFDEWLRWFGPADRRVDFTDYNTVTVSTVFLAIDHNFWGGPPLLFETMIFGGKHDGYQTRCSTWDEALLQHKEACKLAQYLRVVK